MPYSLKRYLYSHKSNHILTLYSSRYCKQLGSAPEKALVPLFLNNFDAKPLHAWSDIFVSRVNYLTTDMPAVLINYLIQSAFSSTK